MSNIKIGNTFQSNNYGQFKIIDVLDHLHVVIKFTATNFKTIVQASKVRTGSVKDLMLPSIYNIGFIGVGSFKPTEYGKITVEYNRWVGMLERCYSESCQKRSPQYVGCSVDREWHNFQNFAKWFKENKPSNVNISDYHLDKDIKVLGNRVYSPTTCLIVHAHVNNSFSHENKIKHTLVDPDNKQFSVTNVTEFCRVNNLQNSIMWKVIKGERKHHKGWTVHL